MVPWQQTMNDECSAISSPSSITTVEPTGNPIVPPNASTSVWTVPANTPRRTSKRHVAASSLAPVPTLQRPSLQFFLLPFVIIKNYPLDVLHLLELSSTLLLRALHEWAVARDEHLLRLLLMSSLHKHLDTHVTEITRFANLTAHIFFVRCFSGRHEL
ncbi:unnamed protein product [Urochloa decumbens]|uniref:Uncharacterized protein n=1 Tax=Urochloa decumbens TaxID=240449 RepID=A0ABC8YWE6_9POAL